MKTKYLPFILIFTLFSCGNIRQFTKTAKSFTYCYDNNATEIENLINIDGFYYDKKMVANESLPEEPTKKYSSGSAYLFFKDGSCVKDISNEWFEAGNQNNQYSSDYSYGAEWGKYLISGDTIKAQYVEPLGGVSWAKNEVWFKVIDKSNIQILYYMHNKDITSQEVAKYMQNLKESDYKINTFIPLNTLPDPNLCWLKKEIWFWCDKPSYRAWKKGLNKK